MTDNGFYNGNDEQDEKNNFRGFGQYNYSWNNDNEFGNPKKPGMKKGTRIVMMVIAAVLFIGISVFAVIGMYHTFINGSRSSQLPKVEIKDIENYDKANNPPVVEGEPLTTVQIVEKCKSSVVGIVSSSTRGGFIRQGSGSGIIMSEDGYIITNQHVINEATSVSVVFENGDTYDGTVIGEDSKSDLAVIKIEATGLQCAKFGNSDNLKEGEQVVAIGNPMGLELFGTATFGYISAINRDITINDRVMTLIQTDASINEGNSGGPLINQYGQVIGINSIKLTSAETPVEGLGFAIPINNAKPIIDSLIEYGYVKDRPLLGISGQDVDEVTAAFYDVPRGVIVANVTEGSGAKKAGLMRGDIIIAAENEEINNMAELNKIKDEFKSGDTITITVWRDGRTYDMDIVLIEDRPQGEW